MKSPECVCEMLAAAFTPSEVIFFPPLSGNKAPHCCRKIHAVIVQTAQPHHNRTADFLKAPCRRLASLARLLVWLVAGR